MIETVAVAALEVSVVVNRAKKKCRKKMLQT